MSNSNKYDRGTPYDRGYTDGSAGRVYDPKYNWTPEQKVEYKRGFDDSRSHPVAYEPSPPIV